MPGGSCRRLQARSLSSQKVDRSDPWVGLLARKAANTWFAGRFTFPGRQAEWLFEAALLHSQWRDRAGLAPDFPVMPSWAPKATTSVPHCLRHTRPPGRSKRRAPVSPDAVVTELRTRFPDERLSGIDYPTHRPAHSSPI
jgi:hypothetical protein